MPEKARWTVAAFAARSASRVHEDYYLREWLPSCERPNEAYSIIGSKEECEEETPLAGQYVSSSAWIDGVESPPGRWPMNYCNHLVSNLTFPNQANLNIERSVITDQWFTPEPGECDQHDYAHLWHQAKDRITLGLGRGYWASHLGAGMVLKDHPYLPLGTDLFSEKVAELDQIALSKMVPQLEGKFKLPVFIGELLELKQLYRYILKLYKQLTDVNVLRRVWGRPLAEASDNWLAAVFGWLPFVSDVKTIVKRFMGIEESLFNFFKNANKRQTLHFQKGLSPETFRNIGWFTGRSDHVFDVASELPYASPLFEAVALDIEKRITVENLVFHATLEFEYRIPAIESFWTQLAAAFDYWGVNLSPSDIWQLVPFSFVVDWVLDVGSWLERFDSHNLNVQVIVYDYCRSFNYDYRREDKLMRVTEIIDANGYHLSGDWTTPEPSLAVHTVKAYTRIPGVPVLDPQLAVEWGLPHGWTLVSAAALGTSLGSNLFSRLLRRRKKKR